MRPTHHGVYDAHAGPEPDRVLLSSCSAQRTNARRLRALGPLPGLSCLRWSCPPSGPTAFAGRPRRRAITVFADPTVGSGEKARPGKAAARASNRPLATISGVPRRATQSTLKADG